MLCIQLKDQADLKQAELELEQACVPDAMFMQCAESSMCLLALRCMHSWPALPESHANPAHATAMWLLCSGFCITLLREGWAAFSLSSSTLQLLPSLSA